MCRTQNAVIRAHAGLLIAKYMYIYEYVNEDVPVLLFAEYDCDYCTQEPSLLSAVSSAHR